VKDRELDVDEPALTTRIASASRGRTSSRAADDSSGTGERELLEGERLRQTGRRRGANRSVSASAVSPVTKITRAVAAGTRSSSRS
jgi:hypothetical protein